MAAGLAKQGMKPVAALYSTFLQRAYDMLLHDVALQQLHVVLAVDRCGIVGEDGETHQGMFDVGYLRQVPGLKIFSPASFAELREDLHAALYACTGPAAIRYPRGGEGSYTAAAAGTLLREGYTCTVICYGTMINAVLAAADTMQAAGYRPEILKLRTISPVDWASIEASARKTKRVFVLEETSDRECLADEIFAHLIEPGSRRCAASAISAGDLSRTARRPRCLPQPDSTRIPSQNDAGGAFLMKHKERLDVLLGRAQSGGIEKQGAGHDHGGRGLCKRAEGRQGRARGQH